MSYLSHPLSLVSHCPLPHYNYRFNFVCIYLFGRPLPLLVSLSSSSFVLSLCLSHFLSCISCFLFLSLFFHNIMFNSSSTVFCFYSFIFYVPHETLIIPLFYIFLFILLYHTLPYLRSFVSVHPFLWLHSIHRIVNNRGGW